VLAALSEGLIDDRTAQRAIERTLAAVEGITAAGYDVEAWLKIPLTWTDG
jgi:predicted RNA-binding protein associated with RNAse of E/G family